MLRLTGAWRSAVLMHQRRALSAGASAAADARAALAELSTETESQQSPDSDAVPSSFSQLGVMPSLVSSLGRLGVISPTPAQAKTIPRLLAGQNVALRADTGTGKSLGLMVVAAQRLLLATQQQPNGGISGRGAIKTLIVVPTRELSWQLHSWTAHMLADAHADNLGGSDPAGLLDRLKPYVQVAYRGSPAELIDQDNDLKAHAPHTLIGTATRLTDLLQAKRIDLSQVELVIVDEGDAVLKPNSRYATLRARKNRTEHPPAGSAFLKQVRDVVSKDCLVAVSSATLNSPTRSELKRAGWLPAGGVTKHITLGSNIASAPSVKHLCVYAEGEEAKTAALVDVVKEMQPTSAIIFRNDMAGLQSTAKRLRAHGLEVRLLDSLLRAPGAKQDPTQQQQQQQDDIKIDRDHDATNDASQDSAVTSRVIGPTDTRGIDLKARLTSAFRSPARSDAFPGPGLWLSSESTIRGIDTTGLSHVFVIDRLDGAQASYVHIAGRLARRAHEAGTAVMIADEATRPTVERLKRDMEIGIEERYAAGQRPRRAAADEDEDDDDDEDEKRVKKERPRARFDSGAPARSSRGGRRGYGDERPRFDRPRRDDGDRERRSGGDRRGGFGGERRGGFGGENRGGFDGERRGGERRGDGERRGGFGGERGFDGERRGGERRGGFDGERRGGFDGERRGGFNGERSGGFGGERRGGFGGERRGGFDGERRGGDRPFDGERRGGERRGGFDTERRGGFDGERRGGFGGERRGDGERRGGFGGERRGDGERRGGFGGDRRGERRGGFDGERRGGYDRPAFERSERPRTPFGQDLNETRRDWKAPGARRPEFGRRHNERDM